MDRAGKIAALYVLVKVVSCSIAGLTYMDALNLLPSKPYLKGEDPCNPLYWYPRHIPDYCYTPKYTPAAPSPKPIPVPPPEPMPLPLLPAPAPQPPMMLPMPMPLPAPPMPLPVPLPMYLPMPAAPAMPMPMPGLMPLPSYPAPAPFPMGPPAYPQNYMQVPTIQRGLVPGVNGLVSPDGAINILPFSDVYSELLEKHKQKMIRRRLQKLLDEYENNPKKKSPRKQVWMDYE
ncbi:nematocyst expressed protein 4-like [Leguminivora glycinivorella]|uniref:nematocyst expressed protein 4-like n=1 Tax=Leguminivora glycinivorella TaxID=1035111 RepID=UPI00200E4EB0|nr:nematocyst expressed protein 4-like [Leguminivora glycinivorella]